MTQYSVKTITAEQARVIRAQVLYHHLTEKPLIYPNDDLASTLHLGIFDHERLIGTCSLFDQHESNTPQGYWQLRGMAVASDYQGRGLGERLIKQVKTVLQQQGAQGIWCNAREPVIAFYQRKGFQPIGERFDIPTICIHQRMICPV